MIVLSEEDDSFYCSCILVFLCLYVVSFWRFAEVPHVSVLTKLDLLSRRERRRLDELLEPNLRELSAQSARCDRSPFARRYRRLTRTLADLVCLMLIIMPLTLPPKCN